MYIFVNTNLKVHVNIIKHTYQSFQNDAFNLIAFTNFKHCKPISILSLSQENLIYNCFQSTIGAQNK